MTSAFILDIISVSSTFALDKIPVFKRESLKRGKKLSFVRRARNSSRARLQRETRAERKAKPSRKRERPPLKRQVHKSRENDFDDRKRELLHCGGCKGFRFRFFLLMKPGRLWLVYPVEGGKEIEISVKMRRWCLKKIKIVRKRLKKLSSSSLKKVKQPGNGAEIMKTPLYIFNYRGGHCRGAVGTCTE